MARVIPFMTTVSTFSGLNLARPIQQALADKKYTVPSPIQAQAIPHLLEGRDLIGCAQTGTGKTAAFALPILHLLDAAPKQRAPRKPRVLILTPTRELAAQIGDSFAAYGKHLSLRHTVVFGGVGQNPQARALSAGVEILVATPGRLLDLREQGLVDLGSVEIFVLDEADRMLDMGFAPDVKRIIARLPAKRQSLLFSATMPPPIMEIADKLLSNPVKVEVAPAATTADRIDQHVCHVGKQDKPKLLVHTIGGHPKEGRVLVFSRTKHGSNKLVKKLAASGIRSEAIHGNKSQTARERALEEFRAGKTRVLVATDIAARGIDVKGISLVINYDIPNEPESYVHRIGRTARAGAEGVAIAFCEPEERAWLRDIEKLIRREVPVMADHPYSIEAPRPGERPQSPPRTRTGGGGRGRPSSRQRSNGGGANRSAGSTRTRSDRQTETVAGDSSRSRGPGRNRRKSSGSSRQAEAAAAPRSAENRSDKSGFWKRFGF